MNKRDKKAVALKYDSVSDAAPRVVAKGEGEIAEAILRLAREHGIPLREDTALVQSLSLIDLDGEIPPELYRAVAEVLAFVYKISGKFPPAS